jgi:hypothetical protein
MRPLLFALALMLPLPAFAQAMQCAPREVVLTSLSKHNHTRRATGIAGQAVMEFYANDETGAWMVTISLPDGRMCLLAAGSDLELDTKTFPPRGVKL